MSSSGLTLLEKLDIPLGFLQAVLETCLIALGAPFRSGNTPKTLDRHLRLTITRHVLARLSPQQLQAIAGTTETNYVAWAKQNGQPVRSVTLPSIKETKAFWIGEPDADNVVIFCEFDTFHHPSHHHLPSLKHHGRELFKIDIYDANHGGGWAMPAAADGHFKFVHTLVERANKAGKSVSSLVLQYDLAPGGQYPRQLTQAVELLRYCVEKLNKSPSNIMLLGDSSGGNLIIGILSHLMHPHPEIKPLQLSLPLKAAMASSPVCLLSTDHPLFVSQEAQDPASGATIKTWMSNYLGSRKPDAWSEPLQNDPSWWSSLDKASKEVLIAVAEVEMMAGDTLACTEKMKQMYNGLSVFVSKVDFHAEVSIGPSLFMAEGEMSRMMIAWALERC